MASMAPLLVFRQSLRPTIIATPSRPLLTATTVLLVVMVITSRSNEQAPGPMVIAAAGAIAGSVILGLDDEANSTLRSSPTSAFVRLAHRLAVLVPALLVAVAALVVADRVLFARASPLPSPTAFVALVTAGVAMQVVCSRHRPDASAEAAAVAVVAWSLGGTLAPDVAIMRTVADAWINRAPWVLGVSIVLIAVGTAGRAA